MNDVTSTRKRVTKAPALPSALHMGAVRLRVSDVERSKDFYTRVIGLKELKPSSDGAVRLGAATSPLVELQEIVDAAPRSPGDTGLFHLALLVPDRTALAIVLRRLATIGVRLGASDHLVSEALYLDDPDGNGIEIYRDRPADAWKWDGPTVELATRPLDLRALLASAPKHTPLDEPMPAETVMGHVHLQVGDLILARDFYVDRLGFDITTDRYPGALFVSAGGYHHHLGLNIWQSRGGGAAPAQSVGLSYFEILLPTAEAVEAARTRLAAAGDRTLATPNGFEALDPWGTRVRIRTAKG